VCCLILGSVTKVQWSDNWVAFGETVLQIVMLQSEDHSQRACLPVALQKIVINPLEHQSEAQGQLNSYNGTPI
jgi:hypothetical protein